MPKIVRIYDILMNDDDSVTVHYAASDPAGTAPPTRWRGLAMNFSSRRAMFEAMALAELSTPLDWMVLMALSEWTKVNPEPTAVPQGFTREVECDLTSEVGIVVRVRT